MSKVVYVSKSRLERKQGPVRVAHLPWEARPVIFAGYGAIAEHYSVDTWRSGTRHGGRGRRALGWVKREGPFGGVPLLFFGARGRCGPYLPFFFPKPKLDGVFRLPPLREVAFEIRFSPRLRVNAELWKIQE